MKKKIVLACLFNPIVIAEIVKLLRVAVEAMLMR